LKYFEETVAVIVLVNEVTNNLFLNKVAFIADTYLNY